MKLQGEVVCAMEATVSGILPSTPCFVLAVLALGGTRCEFIYCCDA